MVPARIPGRAIAARQRTHAPHRYHRRSRGGHRSPRRTAQLPAPGKLHPRPYRRRRGRATRPRRKPHRAGLRHRIRYASLCLRLLHDQRQGAPAAKRTPRDGPHVGLQPYQPRCLELRPPDASRRHRRRRVRVLVPEAPPRGGRISPCVSPGLAAFGAEQLRNSYFRPYLAPNGWPPLSTTPHPSWKSPGTSPGLSRRSGSSSTPTPITQWRTCRWDTTTP